MIALLWVSAASAGDLAGVFGVGRATPASLSSGSARPVFGLAGGTSFGVEPLRFELQGTVRSLAGDGTSEVSVGGVQTEVVGLGGIRGTLVEGHTVRLGADVLAGPALTLTGSTLRVYDDQQRSWSVAPRVAVAAGPWIGVGPLVVSARLQLYAPIRPQWLGYATVGVRF